MTWVLELILSSALAQTPARVVSVSLDPGGIGRARSLSVLRQTAKSRSTYVLIHRGLAALPARRVVPASLARSITRETERWTRRLAKVPRGGPTLGCTQGVTMQFDSRRVPACLDRVDLSTRREFLSWYQRSARWLE